MILFRNIDLKKVSFSFSRFHHHVKLSKGNYNKMNKAYLRHVKGAENYELTFLYTHHSLSVTRQFNFSRQSVENLGNLLGRIKTNVEKILIKKSKKKQKYSDINPVETIPVAVKLVLNGIEVADDVTCVDALKENNVELYILDSKFNIVINAPWVTALALPTSILVGFSVTPAKFEGFFLQRKDSSFVWYTATVKDKTDPNSAKWMKVGEGYSYIATVDDIGKRLKLICRPGDGNQFGPEIDAISPGNIEAGPGFCPFENRHAFTKEKLSGKGLRVVSYNILADLYCDSDFTRTVLYPYCPPYALQYDYRKLLLGKEILGYHSDIYCLQEVDTKVFDVELTPLFNDHGYEGFFTKKGGLVAEGLACYFRSDRFKLVETHSCIIGEEVKTSPILASIWSTISKNEAFVTRLVERATAVQAVLLQSLDNKDEIIVVGNTHLYFHPDSDHVRLTQGGILILWLQNVVEETKMKMPGKRVSVILCGDFNSIPSCGIYQLYTTGVAPSDLEDWRSNQEEALSDVTFSQSLLLSSACGTPEFTNYTVGFADCLDYIFHEKDNMKVTQIVPLPSLEELTQHTALPSIVFPSDHVALIADFEFK